MIFTQATLLAVLAAVVAAKDGRTFAVLRFHGNGPLTVGRVDPIVSPGGAAGHQHHIQGGSNFGLTLGATTLLSSKCTSSLIKNDNSNYWTPSMAFQDPVTGAFTKVEYDYQNVYYFFEATDDKIVAFPPGLQILAGDPSLRTPPKSGGGSNVVISASQPEIQPIQFTCPRSSYNPPSYPADSDGLHGYGMQDPNNKGAGAGFPDQDCDGLYSPMRADIHMPSCYDPSKALTDYKHNMVYPSDAGNGKQNCPPGFIHVPHLFYEVYWNTHAFAGKWTPGIGKQPFVLFNGDKTGYSLHADFVAGWDVPTLQEIIDTCDAGDSGMDKCPNIIGGLTDTTTSCNIPNPIGEPLMTDGSMTLPVGLTATGFGAIVGAPPAPPSKSTTKAAAVASSSVAAAPVVSSTKAVAPIVSTTAASVPVVTVPAISPPVIVAPSNSVLPVVTPTVAVPITTPTAPPTGSGDEDGSCPADPVETAEPVATTVSVATTASVAPTAPAATSTGSATGSASVTSGWSSKGCWSDNLNTRVLSGITFVAIGNHQVTTTACIAYCDKAGFAMAGTEYGGQCFCGNSMPGSVQLDDSRCNMTCEGDHTQTCGGSLSLNVYAKSTTPRRSTRLHRHMMAHAHSSI